MPFNQRADLGDCNKIHSLALRAEYEKASTNRDYEFDEEVNCCDHKQKLKDQAI